MKISKSFYENMINNSPFGTKITIEGTIVGYRTDTTCCNVYPDSYYIVRLKNGDVIEIDERDLFMYKIFNVEPAKDKHWSGKVICTESTSFFWTQGKIYEVENGALNVDPSKPYNHPWRVQFDKCPDEFTFNGHPMAKFIEFKGFANE